MKTPYNNIACASYDELELLAVKSQEIEVRYLKDNQEVQEKMIIKDVYARKGSEYLLNTAGDEIRLDMLRFVDGKEIKFVC